MQYSWCTFYFNWLRWRGRNSLCGGWCSLYLWWCCWCRSIMRRRRRYIWWAMRGIACGRRGRMFWGRRGRTLWRRRRRMLWVRRRRTLWWRYTRRRRRRRIPFPLGVVIMPVLLVCHNLIFILVWNAMLFQPGVLHFISQQTIQVLPLTTLLWSTRLAPPLKTS